MALHDSVIQMVRGTDPVVSKNALARPGTPVARFKLQQTGLFIILTTEVSAWINFDNNIYNLLKLYKLHVFIKIVKKYAKKIVFTLTDVLTVA